MIRSTRSLKWSFKDDAKLLALHWNSVLSGSAPQSWHIPGHSPEQAELRLRELQQQLPRDVFLLWPDAAQEERQSLAALVQQLGSSQGRQQVISQWMREQEDDEFLAYDEAAARWVEELESFHHTRESIISLLVELDEPSRRNESSFSLHS